MDVVDVVEWGVVGCLSGDESESADAVEVEGSGAEFGPADGVDEPALWDLGLAGFDLCDFAFSAGSLAVAVTELRCRSRSSRGGEDVLVGVDFHDATLGPFRASGTERTVGADRRREPNLDPFPCSSDGDVHGVPGRAGDRRRVEVDREVGLAEQSLRRRRRGCWGDQIDVTFDFTGCTTAI